jgi:hypothetical protein
MFIQEDSIFRRKLHVVYDPVVFRYQWPLLLWLACKVSATCIEKFDNDGFSIIPRNPILNPEWVHPKTSKLFHLALVPVIPREGSHMVDVLDDCSVKAFPHDFRNSTVDDAQQLLAIFEGRFLDRSKPYFRGASAQT